MSPSQSASTPQLIEVLPQHRFDESRLADYLLTAIQGLSVPLTVRQFQGGQSNPTFALTDAGGQRYVLRKKPPGTLLPSAHAVDREYRAMSALADSAVPVPRMRLFCADESVIGTAFYVMDYLDGRVIANPAMPDQSVAERTALYADAARTLALLHAVDWQACGLADFGKPERYAERQIDRWTRQYRAAQTEPLETMEWLVERLPGQVPGSERVAIAHGDYRLGNLMFAAHQPKVIAVLDWELATLGHPFADVAYFCMGYHLPGDRSGLVGGVHGLDLAALGIPTQDEFIALYEQASGQTLSDWRFWLALAFFRMASIAQGVYARALQGNAADTRALRAADFMRLCADLGQRSLAGRL